ncbi:MAG: DNA repair protein RecN [Gammaproteobacteria bacterium]|nr:MAG: DNA repair protein RecN [Gammaproteobacteria bacterium]
MLIHLTVRHLAVIDDIELQLNKGMTSLTGETGAGKSILVDALGLVLGDRADSKMVRYGCERAEVSASFDTKQNHALQQWLIEQELDDDEQCHLRRTISNDGRSRAYINGRTVPLAQLRQISELTIDIHGQHAHQSLVRSETQRILLDTVAKTKPLLDELSSAYKQWHLLQEQLNQVQQQSEHHIARLELLQYQVKELEPFELNSDSIESLLKEQQYLANASLLIGGAESGIHQLFEQDQGAAYSLISGVLSDLEKLTDIEPRFVNSVEMLNSTLIQLDECNSDLRHYLDSTDIDPARLDEVENQVTALHGLARKHQVEIEALPAHYQALNDELEQLSHLNANNEKLQGNLDKQELICRQLCKKITIQREKTAAPLAKEISQSIQELAIPGGYVEFVISPMAQDNFNETGSDSVQLLVCTNPGQQAGELGKVASGGELARISLAIQVVTAGSRSVPTLVFDEVDVGIGGGIAEIVGKHLRDLGSTQQVICITHLPQVAAQAHQQLQVRKQHSDGNTHIEIVPLSNEQRIEEIARMLGGVQLTEKTRSHAEEMLNQK